MTNRLKAALGTWYTLARQRRRTLHRIRRLRTAWLLAPRHQRRPIQAAIRRLSQRANRLQHKLRLLEAALEPRLTRAMRQAIRDKGATVDWATWWREARPVRWRRPPVGPKGAPGRSTLFT